jgi:type I restriction enzyme S subunit
MNRANEARAATPPRRFKPYPAYKTSGVEWLGEIPAHWEVERIRHVVGRIEQGWSPECENREADEDEWGVLKAGCVNRGLFIESEHKALPSGLEPIPDLEIATGDLLMSRASGSKELVGSVAVVPRCRPRLLLCDKLFRLHVVAERADRRFLALAMNSRIARWQIEVTLSGGSGLANNIAQQVVKDLIVALPAPNEQEAIAAFLDRETARIDALVAKKERLIELLQEKRTALITQAVTKGLDLNVPMKDSGVEWLGEIPAHWECFVLARVTLARCDGPFGSGLKSEHYSGAGVRIVRLQNIGWAEFLGSDEAYINEAYARELGDHSVVAGDLLIAGLGDEGHPVGRACTAPGGIEPAMVKADCFRFRLNRRLLLPGFAAYQLSATASASAGSLATGATRSRMNLTTTAARKVALPPLDEQHAIVEVLDQDGEKFRMLVERIGAAIDRLKELRTALISEAVTGKIDVRDDLNAERIHA